MEVQALPHKPPIDYRSNVDTSRPFRSVKEAVAVFGDRILTGEIYSPKPFTFSKQGTSPTFSPSPQIFRDRDDPPLEETLKKLEAELEETKTELKLLKERESETEVALASLNAELHKNMSKMAKAEAAAAAKAAVTRVESSPTLAQILSVAEKEVFLYGEGRKKEKKKKPIIPLVGDLFRWKKGSSASLQNSIYSSPNVHWN
ncbi:hypothetical protein RJ639_037584 [Escallonia herrerae]|uniref:Uncharacterized protein n=1 Tax=Escallonia herrerae TaxID=1293975 RepID=A0AA88WW33_9ASTE|nr:hypothetical protein RJ639_037584 [Escallonia herrerae]